VRRGLEFTALGLSRRAGPPRSPRNTAASGDELSTGTGTDIPSKALVLVCDFAQLGDTDAPVYPLTASDDGGPVNGSWVYPIELRVAMRWYVTYAAIR
jgi:hypothetical protein